MSTYPKVNRDDVLLIANHIARSSSNEFPTIFEGLRRRGQLSATVHDLNRLLDEPTHQELALTALKRFGLEHGG
jgi:hypothetical protein